MERHFEAELRNLKQLILAMGGCVEKAVEQASRALIERKPEGFDAVYELEKTINQSHIQVDDACVNLLARQSPLAADLRLVVSVIKINTDLERMGDQAVNISYNGREYLKNPLPRQLVIIPKMAQEVQSMVRQALDAFVTQNSQLAREVLRRDDTVDGLKNQIFHDLTAAMKADTSTVEASLNLILIARNLERIGDHATNIAEDVIFAYTGEDIRHQGPASPAGSKT